jgi:hypothetical protein
MCNSKGSAFITLFNKPQPVRCADIHDNSLSVVPVRQRAFDDAANYNVLDTGDIVESPNQLSYSQVVCPTIGRCNCEILATGQFSVRTATVRRLNCIYHTCPTRRETFCILSYFALRASINRPALSTILHFVIVEGRKCGSCNSRRRLK